MYLSQCLHGMVVLTARNADIGVDAAVVVHARQNVLVLKTMMETGIFTANAILPVMVDMSRGIAEVGVLDIRGQRKSQKGWQEMRPTKVPYHSAIIQMLLDTGVGTLNPEDRLKCCGMVRDLDGFCQHRSYHPIHLGQYVEEN